MKNLKKFNKVTLDMVASDGWNYLVTINFSLIDVKLMEKS